MEIASIAVKATVVILCAFGVAATLRRSRASLRHAIYSALFVTLLVLPLASRFVPSTPIELPLPAVPQAASVESSLRETATVFLEPRAAIESAPVATVSKTASGWNFLEILGNLYFAGVVLLLAMLATGVWRMRRIAADAEPWLEGMHLAAEVACDPSIRRAVLVVISDEVTVPLTFGSRRQSVIMPAAAESWSPEAIRRALRHEIEHVRREDWMMQIVARIACAFYWPHPLIWIAWRRFYLEAERACDDAVLSGSDGPMYADQLVSLARGMTRPERLPALAMASRSRLSERIHAILDASQPRGPQSRTATIVTASVMFAFVITFGSLRLVAATADSGDSDAHAGEAVSGAMADAIDGAMDDPDGHDDAVAEAMDPESLQEAVNEGVSESLDEIETFRESIIRAAEKGNIDALDRLFRISRVDINTPFIGDGTALLIAARAGHIDTVRWLLASGADPNVPSPGDGNALIGAAGAGRTEIMKLLLDRGARIEDVVPGDENALITAAAAGSDQAVKLLIARGANVNARVWADGREWRTPLLMARRTGHRDIVRLLIEAGARD